jgi:hypothetical protein
VFLAPASKTAPQPDVRSSSGLEQNADTTCSSGESEQPTITQSELVSSVDRSDEGP